MGRWRPAAGKQEVEEMSSSVDRRAGPLALAGVLLSAAAAVILMGIITAEALYPAAYSTSGNEISDLGGTRPPNSVVLQPSAAIFDGTMLVAGALILAAALLVHRGMRRSVSTALGLFGAGVFLVGVFPGNTGPHPLVALFTFVTAGVAALVAARAQSAPGRYVSIVLGTVTLVSLFFADFLLDWGPIAELGDGGIERWIAYPAVLWLAVFGGCLMSGALMSGAAPGALPEGRSRLPEGRARSTADAAAPVR